MPTRSYLQHCGLAASLDVLGERWTLLVLRELALGPRRFGELHARLDGIATNLLAARLKALEEAGVVRREPAGYALSEAGDELRPVLEGLSRWGLRHALPEAPAPGAAARAAWAALTMRAELARAEPDPELTGLVALVVGDERLWLWLRRGEAELRDGTPPVPPDATLACDLAALAALGRGQATLDDPGVAVAGDRALVERLLAAGFALPAPA